jgi:hypothetical protein
MIVLGMLVAANATFCLLMRSVGPLIGAGFYLVLLINTYRSRESSYQPVILGGIAGFIVHILEVILIGWTPYPPFMILNLIFPIILLGAALSAGREV